MKIIFVIFYTWICTSILVAQYNINPDPTGDPWIVGGVPEITYTIKLRLDSLQAFQINPY